MYRPNKQDNEEAEKLSGKQQRPTAEGQDRSSMSSHDQAQSNLTPVRLAAEDPSTSHEFQVAQDEGGGVRQKDLPSSPLAHAGTRTHLEESIPSAQGNTRERESSSYAADSTPSTLTFPNPSDVAPTESSTTVSQPGVMVAPTPIHPTHTEIQSDQNTPSDSLNTSLDTVPPLTSKLATPQSSRSSSKKKKTWYGMEVRDNSDPSGPGPGKASPFSLGFGYKEHKKAALAAANAAAVSDAASHTIVGSPVLSSPLTASSSSANHAAAVAALRSHSFSPSQDRPVHVQETMHAPDHHRASASEVVPNAPKIEATSSTAVPSASTAAMTTPTKVDTLKTSTKPKASKAHYLSKSGSIRERFASSPKFSKLLKNIPGNMGRSPVPPPSAPAKLPGAFPDSPAVAPVAATGAATLPVVPVYSTPTASNESLPTLVGPVQSTAGAVAVQDPNAVIPAYSTPILSQSVLPFAVARAQNVSAASVPVAQESTSTSKSAIATAAAAVTTAAVGVFKKLTDHPEPPKVDQEPVTPADSDAVVSPAAKTATLPMKLSTAAALKTPKKNLSLYDEEESTYPRGDEGAKLENPAHPAVVEDVIEIKKLPKEFHSTAAVLKKPKKNLSLYDEEEGAYPRGDEVDMHENPAHPPSVENIVKVKRLPQEAFAAVAVPAVMAMSLPEKHSTAAALKTPKKDLSLYDEEQSTYPRGDEGAKLENPAHPAVVEDVIEIKKLPKELHSTAAVLKKPKKNLSLYDEEEGAYPRGDEVDMHENPAHPPSVENIVKVKRLPQEAFAAVTVPAVMAMSLPEKHSTAAALKTPKKDLSLYDEEQSTYPRGDEGAKLENPAHPAVVEDVIEIKKLPKEFHSTAAVLKKPKKNLSLYDEEEGAYPRGDEVDMHENPAHPPSVENIVKVKRLPQEAFAAVTVPAVMAMSLPEKHSTAAALKTPKKDLSLYDEEQSTYPRGDEGAKLENPAHPAVVEDVIEIKKLPKEFHSTAAVLKKPKKNLSLYDEEEGAYPRGDEVDMRENPAHPPSVENIVKVKRLPQEAFAAVTVPAVMAMSLPEKHSTAAALKTPKKDLSLYDEEQSTYPRGDEGAKLENPAHPAVVEDVIEIKKLPKEFHSTAAVLKKPKKDLSLYDEEESTYPRGDEATHHENPAHPQFVEDIVEVKELLSAETPTGGDRRGSQSSMKEKVKGAFSGFHMPKLGRRKDETEAEVEATASTTHVKPAVVTIAAAAPVAARIAAALRDTSDDEPFIEPPHHRLTSAPAVIAEPLYHKPAAPLIDEEKLTSISARKLEPLSVLPPTDSVMVTDKATTTEPGRHSHEVTSHPHVAPDTITAAAVVPAEMKETAEVGTATSQASATATHPAQRTDSLKIKASHLAAAVAAPLIAAKDKITGHHHDNTATHTTTPSTATTAITPASGIHPSRTAVDMPKEQTVVERKILGKAPDDVASKIPHNDDEEVVMVETITTKTIPTFPPTRTHVYEPGGTTIAAAGDPIVHATEVTPAVDAKGKGRHEDHSPIVPVVASVPAVVDEETPEAVVEVTETETKEAKKEREKKEKQTKKAEAKLNKVPLKTKFKKLTAPGITAAASVAVNYNDRMPTHPMPVLHVQEHDVNKPVPPAVPAPLLTLTEDDVENPEIPEVAAPILTMTEDDVEKPYPILTKHPVLTVPESDVESPSALDAPYPVIPYVAPKSVSTSALKVASAPRPMIPAQPVQGKDIKFPKIKVPKIKAPKMPRLKKKNAKVAMTAAAVVPVAKTAEVPEPVVETVTTSVVEPVVVRKPKPVVVPDPIPKPVPVEAPPQPIAMHTPAPAPVVVPTISTNVETVIPHGYSGAIPRIAGDESLIWIKKVHTKNDFYDSEDEDELDELGHRKDRDVSRYVAPSKSTPHSGYGTTPAGGVDNKQEDYTLANHTNAGIVNTSQPHRGYNTQPRQSAL